MRDNLKHLSTPLALKVKDRMESGMVVKIQHTFLARTRFWMMAAWMDLPTDPAGTGKSTSVLRAWVDDSSAIQRCCRPKQPVFLHSLSCKYLNRATCLLHWILQGKMMTNFVPCILKFPSHPGPLPRNNIFSKVNLISDGHCSGKMSDDATA